MCFADAWITHTPSHAFHHEYFNDIYIHFGIMGVLSSKCVLIGWVAPADELFRGEALLWTSVWVCEEVFDVHALAADHLHISSSKSKRPHLGFAVFPLLFHAMELSSQFSSTSPVLSSF